MTGQLLNKQKKEYEKLKASMGKKHNLKAPILTGQKPHKFSSN